MSPNEKPTLPVSIYMRVSRTGGRDVEAEGGTAAVQESMCRKQAELDGLTVGQVFTDLDESGGKTSRPQFDRMLAAIREGKSGGVIVRNLRRFGRTTTGVIEGVREIEERGGAFVSVEEKIDTSSPMGRFALTIFAALGTMELEERTETWRAARERAIGRGVQIGPAPAGYDKIEEGPDKGKLVPNEHAPTIRRAFMRRAQGASWSEVSGILTEAGVPTWRGADALVAQRGLEAHAERDLHGRRQVRRRLPEREGPRGDRDSGGVESRERSPGSSSARPSRRGRPGGRALDRPHEMRELRAHDGARLDGARRQKDALLSVPERGRVHGSRSITFAKVEPWAEKLVRGLLAAGTVETRTITDDVDVAERKLVNLQAELTELIDSEEPIPPAVLAKRASALEARIAEAQAALDAAQAMQVGASPLAGLTGPQAFDLLTMPMKREAFRGLVGTLICRKGSGPLPERIAVVPSATSLYPAMAEAAGLA